MAFKMKGSPMQRNFGIKTPFEQSSGDVKEWLVSEKGFTQSDADSQIKDGAYDVTNKSFLAWYKNNKTNKDLAASRTDAPVENEGQGAGQDPAFMMSNPFKQEKTKKSGPAVKKCKGDLIYHAPSDKCMTVDEYEDAMGKGSGNNRKVFKDGPKNQTVIRGKDGKTKVLKSDWQAHQFGNK